MAGDQVSGVAIGCVAAGSLLLFAGIEGYSIPATLQDVIKGTSPLTQAQLHPITVPGTAATTAAGSTAAAGDTGAANAGAAANQAIARVLAAPYGWATGQQWADLVSLWNRESGWSNTAENSGSGAYGIAQALGHGPTNQYPAGPANPPTSSASAQISWGLGYIKATYGSPSAAWAHEVSAGWY